MISRGQHEQFQTLVDGADRFVLTTHLNPDGDAIGSQVGLALFLKSRGKEVRIVNQDPVPLNLQYAVTPELAVEPYDPERHDPVFQAAERVLLLDNSAPDRLGAVEGIVRAHAPKTFCIDHHPTRGTPWAGMILVEDACATAAMVYELVREAGWELTREAAEALYLGLATDTGYFRFNSTQARAHEIAAELLNAGADPSRCYREVYERNSAAYTRLLGRILSGLRLDAGGALASTRITWDEVAACCAEAEDTSEMTTPLLALDGVQVVLLFRELQDRRIKVSLRSKGLVDVHRLALEFGGGGHRNASGIVLDGRLDEVSDRITSRAAEILADETSRAL
jgi:bifunctional oligoribonuclease and PAP phosphatase NrnA